MSLGRPLAPLQLEREQREQLEAMTSSRSLPHGLVTRVRIVLLSADGLSSKDIAARFHVKEYFNSNLKLRLDLRDDYRYRSGHTSGPCQPRYTVQESMSTISEIEGIVQRIYKRYQNFDDGEVATYIPELAKANPRHFGICLATVDGHVFRAGDWEPEFTIQSICKPFAFQMALEKCGRDETLRHVGVEPSGDAFNSIELEPKTMRPFNPMINAGAIAISSLIKENPVESGIAEFVERMQLAAGRPLRIDPDVLASETTTGNRNRAIAYLMLNCGIINGEVDHTLHQYFSQCSLLVNCQNLAMMAVTLANMGLNPATGKHVFNFQYIKDVLTLMFTCGLYDHAGEWAYRVGLPAKSGVGGGILAVVNRQLGIGVYSPKLDAKGNSVRGILACKDLASDLGLHAFEFTNVGSNFMQAMMQPGSGTLATS